MSFFSTPTISSSSSTIITKARISSNYNGARNKPGPKKLYTSSPPRKQASSRKSPKLKTKKLPSLHHNSVASGGDATTYTCLPPKDEVFLGGFGEESGVEAEVVSFSKYEYDRLVSLNDGLGKRLDFDEGSVGRLDFGDDGVVEDKGYKGLGKRLDFDEGNVERLDFDDDRVVEAKEYKGLGKRLDFDEDSVEMIGFDDDSVVEGKGYEFDGLNKGKRLDFDEDGVEIIDFDDDSVVEASDRLLSLNKGLGKRLNIGGNEVKRLDFDEDNVERLDFDEDNVVEAKGYECDELLSLDEGLEEGLDFDGEDEGVVEKGVMSFDGNGESLDFDDEDEGVVGKGVMKFEGNGRKVGNGGSLEFDYGKFELYELDGDGSDFDEDEEGGVGDVDVVEFEGEEGEEIKEKEKGVPAVMRCFDRAKIMVRAGDGGNGVVAFRREKFVPLGGPSGGDGGRGGNVYVEVEGSMNSLLPFRQKVHFRAGRGSHGQGSKQNGARGEDVVVKVPPGTVIRQAADESGEQGEVLLELLHPGQRALLLPGGKGGRGNASFKSGMNKVPKIAENGEQGIEMWLDLELKLVADVGIIGAPNAGKSTFLSVVSAAQPAIANYPFTTLLPNLGVVTFGFDASIVVADLPGLLEGAHRGFGLGHEFLRHTERCSVLVHVIDGSSQQPEYEFDAVRLELEMFNPEVTEKPYLVVYNKMDLPEASENWISFRESLRARGIEPFCMSAAMADGTYKVICAAYELVRKKREAYKDDVPGEVNLNHVADMMQKQRTSPINDFEITHDSDSGTWHVDGAGLQRFVQMTNWRYLDSERRFQHVLDACGVFKSLVKLGVKEGDTVLIGEMELVWHDSSDSSGPARLKKWAEKSIK